MVDAVLSLNAFFNIADQIGSPFKTNLGMTRGAIDRPQPTTNKVTGPDPDDTVITCRQCRTTILIHSDEAMDIAQYSRLQGHNPEIQCDCSTYVQLPL